MLGPMIRRLSLAVAPPAPSAPPRYRWWHAAAFEAAMQLVQAPVFLRRSGPQTYRTFKQASFAPPSWVFGPVWFTNNVSVLWGNLRLLNLPADHPHRRRLLWLQGASWGIYATFSYVYFGLNSPILAATWTVGMYALTWASLLLASKIDAQIVASLVTLLIWLTLASAVAIYQALYNADPLFGTPAWR